jgi:uncharacterized membrane protein YkoI
MKASTTFALAAALAFCGCKSMHDKDRHGEDAQRAEAAEVGEKKIPLQDAPPAVRATIDRELQDAKLEDIAVKQKQGRTVYETDIIRGDGKYEVNIGEDGNVLSRLKEGSAEEKTGNEEEESDAHATGWQDRFDVNKADLQPTGQNHYMPLQPGSVVVMRHGIDSLTITILRQTRMIDGVECAILEERETKNGQLEEVSRNFFATNSRNNDVYYFGEDVDVYKEGKIVNHESEWHAGEKGARCGLMMPGKPKKGQKFSQELAPKVAMDRVEVVSTDETVKTPAGTIQHCLHLRETTPLESDVSDKYYASGIGLIKDDEFELAAMPR